MPLDLLFNVTAPSTVATLIPSAIEIRHRSATQMAPESVTLQVDVDTLTTPLGLSGPGVGEQYDERLTVPTFVWTFGDSYSFTSSTNTSTLTSAQALGPVAQHTYRAPGTYNVRVDIYMPNGARFYSTSTVTISAFSGTTITVGPSGRDYTSFGSALSAALGTETGATRIVLDRGQSYSFSGQTIGSNSGNLYNNLSIIAASGGGADPIINCTGGITVSDDAGSAATGTKHLTFQNLDIRGPFSSVTNTGSQIDFFTSIDQSKVPGTILFDGGRMAGFNFNTYIRDLATGPQATHLVLNDAEWTDYRFTMVYAFQLQGVISTGSSITSHVDARVWDGVHNGGFHWRTDAELEIISKSDLFCKQGWSDAGSFKAYQGIRIGADGTTGTEAYVSESFFEGGFGLATFNGTDDANNVAKKAIVIDSNIWVANWQTGDIISAGHGGMFIRNNLAIWPNTSYVDRTAGALVRFADGGGVTANRDAPIRVYNNTVVNLRTSGSPTAATISTFTDTEVVNNIFHRPNLGAPSIADAPLLDSGSVLMTPREVGYINESGTLSANQASPATTAYSFAPETGSAAIADATGTVAPLDRTGTERPTPRSRGASEAVA